MVAHTFNPNTCEFKASLMYIDSSKTTWRDTVEKKKNKNKRTPEQQENGEDGYIVELSSLSPFLGMLVSAA